MLVACLSIEEFYINSIGSSQTVEELENMNKEEDADIDLDSTDELSEGEIREKLSKMKEMGKEKERKKKEILKARRHNAREIHIKWENEKSDILTMLNTLGAFFSFKANNKQIKMVS